VGAGSGATPGGSEAEGPGMEVGMKILVLVLVVPAVLGLGLVAAEDHEAHHPGVEPIRLRSWAMLG